MPFISSAFASNAIFTRTSLATSPLRCRRPRVSRPSSRRTPVSEAQAEAPNESSAATHTDTKTEHTDIPFSWTESWYPICIVRDAPVTSPLALTLFEKPLVLFRESPGNWCVLDDRCSHRLTPLSEGRITTSAAGLQELECAYHGWSFNECGTCTRIPQLDSGASIPKNSAVRRYATRVEHGVIRVYLGDEVNAPVKQLPIPDVVYSTFNSQQLNEPSSTFSRFIQYSLETWVENIADPDHTNFAHHGASKMFDRKRGGNMVVTERPNSNANGKIDVAAKVIFGDSGFISDSGFIPPSTAYYHTVVPDVLDSTSLFMAIPLTRNTCRIFNVTFTQFVKGKKITFFVPFILKLKPVWADRLHKNIVLDGDSMFLRKILNQLGDPPNWDEMYLPVKKIDYWVIELRKFFDRYRGDMPWTTPHGTEAVIDVRRENLLERYHSHTEHYAICSGAYTGFSRAVVITSLIAKVPITALVSVLVSTYLGNPAVLQDEQMRSVRNTVVLLCAIIVVALGLPKKLAWYKQQFVYSEEAGRRWLTT